MNAKTVYDYMFKYLDDLERNISNTSWFFKIHTYDFGWYAEISQKTDIVLFGGPEHGILFSNVGNYTNKVHYVGTIWDTGIGSHWENGAVVFKQGNSWIPSPYVINHFKKYVIGQQSLLEGTIKKPSFVERDGDWQPTGYNLEFAAKWLKVGMCYPHEKAYEWIGQDSGQNTTVGGDCRIEVMDIFNSIENKGLYPDNWDSYSKMNPLEAINAFIGDKK